jgi:hypothetical protein
MAKIRKFANGRQLSLPVTSGVVSGDPVNPGGLLTGVALTDRDSAGNATVDFGGVYTLSCKGETNAAAGSAIAVGDALYFTAGHTPKIDKYTTGTFFGYALSTLGSGSTGNVDVLVSHP